MLYKSVFFCVQCTHAIDVVVVVVADDLNMATNAHAVAADNVLVLLLFDGFGNWKIK